MRLVRIFMAGNFIRSRAGSTRPANQPTRPTVLGFTTGMRKTVKVLGWIVGVVLVLAIGAAGMARVIAGHRYEGHWVTHEAPCPIPFPLTEAEAAALRSERRASGDPTDEP